jgi:O-antigen ligase
LSIFYKSILFFFLPFILLAFPSAVNDFIPSVIITSEKDIDFVGFPLITHIDIYFFFLINMKKKTNNHFRIILKEYKFNFLRFFIAFSFIGAFLLSNSDWDIFLLLGNSYQIRYLILIPIFLSQVKFINYENQLINGFIFSICFLLLESFLFTKINDLPRLTSGSLGVNTFGNIIASLILFLIWLYYIKVINIKKFIFTILICITIILGSETRSSIFIIPLFFTVILIISLIKKPIKLFYFFSFFLFLVWLYKSNLNVIPERYSFNKLYDNISIKDIVNVKNEANNVQLNQETSSIITRIKLWSTSLRMIEEHPIIGIGVGRWNKEKKLYGYNENVLIDSHNDFFSFCSQYGVITGILFSYFIFILPIILYFKLKKLNHKSTLMGLTFINGGMFISAFSNSGSFKHQVFAILIFNLFYVLYSYFLIRQKINEES